MKIKLKLTHYLALTLNAAVPLSAAIIGTNPPAMPLTAERITTLPKVEQPAWKKYLKRSERQLQADQAFLFNEMKRHRLQESLIPPPGHSTNRLRLNQPPEWYGQADGQRIADIVISFQTPAGGWSKNLDMTRHRRAPGEHFASDNTILHVDQLDHALARDLTWNYAGTFDNRATTTQLRFLAKVITAVGPKQNAAYRAAFLRGLDYIFVAQFPNGGWPQVWPLQGGYHDAITYNDGAVIETLQILTQVAEAANEFTFVPPETRARAAASVRRGLECVLNTQIVAAGRATVWCQQHDPLTLQPVSARNYEMPSLCGSESAGVMTFLMRLPNPDARTIHAVHAAAAWFEKTKLSDVAFKAAGQNGRELVPTAGAAPLWARYYEIGGDRPIFGDRDKTIHDNVSDISLERRNGYGWFNESPGRALEIYSRWRETHPPGKAPGS